MSSAGTVHDGLAISMSDVLEAMKRIREHVHYTPVMECSYLNSLSSLKLFMKCEQFQKSGAFKIRGATNAIMKLQEERKRTGKDKSGPLRVVTQSSGNHGLGLAMAAKSCGISATVVMPSNCPPMKVKAIEDQEGEVILGTLSVEGQMEELKRTVEKYAPNSAFVPSSNHPDIMAGQGTIALELLDQVPKLDAIVASVCGGGLLAGISVVSKTVVPNIKVFAAEPENADDCARSFAAGKIVPNESWPDTICDALKNNIQDKTWPILKTHLSGVITVTEEEVVEAMRTVWERMKITIEPSAACTVAAVLSPKFKELAGPDVQRVGVVLCGGNVDLDNLPWTDQVLNVK